MAAKLISVLSWRVALRRNSLRLHKKFSMRWRHRYIAKSQGMRPARFNVRGMTAAASRSLNSARRPLFQLLSKALPAIKASKSMPVISGLQNPAVGRAFGGDNGSLSW